MCTCDQAPAADASPPRQSTLDCVLASASTARLATLRNAGIEPRVIVSNVDESVAEGLDSKSLSLELAVLKAQAVADTLTPTRPTLVIGCDSVLDVDGRTFGKPASPDEAREIWRLIRARSGVVYSGHHVIFMDATTRAERSALGSTRVDFGFVSDLEIDAYVATGEPLEVAGGFTINRWGGAFVEGVVGDPHNVVGISLPLVRSLAQALGVSWDSLWNRSSGLSAR